MGFFSTFVNAVSDDDSQATKCTGPVLVPETDLEDIKQDRGVWAQQNITVTNSEEKETRNGELPVIEIRGM